MAERPETMLVEIEDLATALGEGIADMRRAPGYAALFAGIYVAGGWLVYYALAARGELWLTLPASTVFPILGPFVACGYYEISRRLDTADSLRSREVLGAVLRQKDRQLPSICAVVVMLFLVWNFAARMICALFLGSDALSGITASFAMLPAPAGIGLLATGAAVGAAFSAFLFAITVVSLPMLLDREVDFVTAMIASFRLVRRSPVVMLGWGGFIAVVLLVSMLPGFLGLFVALPVFGHASWHLYRRVIAWEEQTPA